MYSFSSCLLGKTRAAPHSVTRILPFLHTRVRQQHSLDDIKKYVEEWDSFKAFQPEYNKKYTNILNALASATIEPCSKSGIVEVLKMTTNLGDVKKELTPHVIFVRSMYNKLLEKIRKFHSVALIGNPGIGKSWFQWYYLARLTNPELLRQSSLPPDCYGNTEPPKVVIRQEEFDMVVFFLEAKQAYSIPAPRRATISCFNPETSLYFFEPGETINRGPYFRGLSIPTLATLSPATIRYKEFCKNGGEKLFMPNWSFEELKDVYQFIKNNRLVPNEMQNLYSDEEIENRFKQFGGILRHVLPRSEKYLDETKKNQESAIDKADLRKLLARSHDIEDADISHFILQYKVEMQGPKAFENRTMDWVSSDVEFQVKAQFDRISTQDRIQFLIEVDEGRKVDVFQSAPKIYESVVADQLKEGVRWPLRNVNQKGDGKEFNVKLKTTDTNSPKFKEMVEGTLYKPARPNYPVFDMMYVKKEKDKMVLTGIQVTTQGGRREVNYQTFENWKKEIGIDDDNKVHFILCPHPSDANKASISFKGFQKELPYQVLQIPTGYGS